MNKRQRVAIRLLASLALTIFLAVAFSSLALAQQAQVVADAGKMMTQGFNQFNDGQRMVIEGVNMNSQIAVQQGVDSQMNPGNQTITTGRETFLQGATLFAQGEQTFLNNQSTVNVAKQGIKMMRDGFKIAQNGYQMIKQGVGMNNQVAQSGGFANQFAQGNQIIQTGLGTMDGGAQLFMQGEALYIQNFPE
jgi:hypothetical protein